jgi:long-chain fatty acid transport protein
MKGKQYIYGGQFNITRKINDNFSAAVGIRANYYDGYSRGFVNANMGGADLIDLQLDCIQRGWGFAPIFSFDYHDDRLTISARYEFRTKLATDNDTRTLTARIKNA